MVFAAEMAAFQNGTVLCLRLAQEHALRGEDKSAGQELSELSHHCGVFYGFCLFPTTNMYFYHFKHFVALALLQSEATKRITLIILIIV